MQPRVSVLIPTYNEKENMEVLIPSLVEEFGSGGIQGDIIVIDDSSIDGTLEVVRGLARVYPNVHLIVRPEKLGIGSAYIEGFRWCLNNTDPDVMVQMDADLSHPPSLLKELVRSVVEEYSHVVIASRYVEGGGVRGWGAGRRLMSIIANVISRSFLRLKIHDATSGYRALSNVAVKMLLSFRLVSLGLPYQIESLHIFKLLNLRIKEIPFTFTGRIKGKSKLSFSDIPSFLLTVLRLIVIGVKPLAKTTNPQIVGSVQEKRR